MASLRITGWNDGLQKVSMTKMIREHTDLGLKESKAVTDKVLVGAAVELQVADNSTARALARELTNLGAVVVADQNPA